MTNELQLREWGQLTTNVSDWEFSLKKLFI